MTKLRCIVSFICLFLFVASTVSAQKNVKRILDYYESEAYYLTIKKIKSLKSKDQSRPRIQLLLADSYWQTGNKKRSTEIYEDLAVANKIPVDFQTKYERVMLEKNIYTSVALNSIPAEYFEIPSAFPETKGSIVQPFFTKRKPIPKFELTPQKTYIESVPAQAKIAEVKSSVTTTIKSFDEPVLAAIALANVKPIEIKRINEKRLPVSTLVNNQGKNSEGKYRIRVAVPTSEEVSHLVEYLGVTEVDIFEWAQRKIVVAGFYESPNLAQAFIDQYLKHFYKKIAVVTKVDGRYKSLDQVL